MRTQVIANSTMRYTSSDGKTITTHCLMSIDENVLPVSRAEYTFYIWEWDQNISKSQVDSEIAEINTLCGRGHIHPNIILRIDDDVNLFGKRNYSPLDNISLNFKFNGWHGINTDTFNSIMEEYEGYPEKSLRNQINDYINEGKRSVVRARRRNRTNSV
jgi:hypothetical protein